MRYAQIATIAVLLLGGAAWLFCGETTLTVIVTDEAGKPIPQATVLTGWSRPIAQGKGWGEEQAGKARGTTDEDGIAQISIGGVGPLIVKHPDYYLDGKTDEQMMAALPNPVLAMNRPKIPIALLKKLQPVPMYVRKLSYRLIPVLGQPLGFDLQVADWVAPFGAGKLSDFVIYCEREVRSNDDYTATLRITFSNKHDGIMKNETPLRNRIRQLRLPREAPLDGYQSMIEQRWGRGPAMTEAASRYHPNENANYIFRIRSVADESGRLQSAIHGKIHGDIVFSPATGQDKPAIAFTYYLNPGQNRSLEWDCENNLFGQLPIAEKPSPEP